MGIPQPAEQVALYLKIQLETKLCWSHSQSSKDLEKLPIKDPVLLTYFERLVNVM